MANYCEIQKEEMKNLLESKGFKQVWVKGCKELVWEKDSKVDSRVALRVYSSITGETSRGCGEDAIRVVVWDSRINRPVTGAIRTNRVPGWQDRMVDKLKELASSFKFIRCQKCGSYMMKREGKHGVFLGCSNFPNCK